MTKEEFKQERIKVLSERDDLAYKQDVLETVFIEEHREFQDNEKLSITGKSGITRYAYCVGAYINDFHEIEYKLMKAKKDGTMSKCEEWNSGNDKLEKLK